MVPIPLESKNALQGSCVTARLPSVLGSRRLDQLPQEILSPFCRISGSFCFCFVGEREVCFVLFLPDKQETTPWMQNFDKTSNFYSEGVPVQKTSALESLLKRL